MRGVFEEFAEGKPVTQKFPRIPYAEAMLEIWLRQAGPAQPAHDRRRDGGVRARGRHLQRLQERDPAGGVVRAIPAPERRRSRARSSTSSTNGRAREGAAGPRLHRVRATIAASCRQGADRQVHSGRGAGGDRREGRAEGRRRGVLRRRRGGEGGYKLAGKARVRVGDELELVEKERFEFCWIVDFPMYEWNEDEKKIDFSHNPFSMPQGGPSGARSDTRDPLASWPINTTSSATASSCRPARSATIGPTSCARPSRSPAMARRCSRKIRRHVPRLQYGAPPHGGIAPGIDRIVMLLCGEQNLREVVLFPMNQRAEDLLMGAPSEVTPKQLRELHIRLNLPRIEPASASGDRRSSRMCRRSTMADGAALEGAPSLSSACYHRCPGKLEIQADQAARQPARPGARLFAGRGRRLRSDRSPIRPRPPN